MRKIQRGGKDCDYETESRERERGDEAPKRMTLSRSRREQGVGS